ncbi:hypothetical protein F511_00022 [Dorcoceras hygrometricum]|nr:hypothetical protein F511_00022 [Dorcoceras hygrometricum]
MSKLNQHPAKTRDLRQHEYTGDANDQHNVTGSAQLHRISTTLKRSAQCYRISTSLIGLAQRYRISTARPDKLSAIGSAQLNQILARPISAQLDPDQHSSIPISTSRADQHNSIPISTPRSDKHSPPPI